MTPKPAIDFEATGWSVIPGFVDPGELGPIAAGLDQALALPRPPCMARPGNDLTPLRWNDTIVAMLIGSRSRMQRLGSLLQANDLKWLSGYVSIKAPHSPALWWHQDWWCWDHPISFHHAATQVAVLCYLTNTDEENGALRVLPGSHLESYPIHGRLPEAHGERANALPVDHPAMRDCPGQVTVPVNAGDAVVLDYRLLHGTHPNATPHRRDCVLLSFIPDWGGLPAEIKAHLAMHPALPSDGEAAVPLDYRYLLPRFAGMPASLTVNRLAPALSGMART